MKQPLLWFFIVGCILFGADRYFLQQPDRVIADAGVRDHLDKLWQSQTGQAATPDELDSLLENWIREEVFYREALRLGLDRDDSIVRRRMVQKLGFLVEEVEAQSGEWQAMEAYYQQNVDAYFVPERYSYAQILMRQSSSAAGLLAKLKQGARWQDLGQPSLLHDSYQSRSAREITASLGPDFANALVQLEPGSWVGPIKSSFGHHLVRIEAVYKRQITPLAYIEKKVMSDYRQSRLDAVMDDYYQQLRQKYRVVYE